MEYVLIIILSGYDKPSTTHHAYFKNKEYCENAKQKVDALYSDFGHATGAIRTVCVPTGEVKETPE